MLFDELAESQTVVQLPHQNQVNARSDPRTLEINLQ
jgi:hypothetical protein